jgi:hypothetical protein
MRRQSTLCKNLVELRQRKPSISTIRDCGAGAALGKLRPTTLPSTAAAVPARRINRAREFDPF